MKKENNVKSKPFHLLIKISHYILYSVFTFLALNVNAYADKREVRVGVYANKPLVYQDENGEHKGLSIDMLRFVASKENWKLEFVPCPWSECLEMLNRGENDIQVIIAKTPERAKIYDFTSQSLYSLWAQIFIHPDSDIESWTDLKGKNVAVYRDDLFSERFKKLIGEFGIDCNLLEVASYQSMLTLIKEKKADAGVFIQTFGEPYAIRGIIRRTPIMFNPVPIYYAFPKGKVPELVTAIDFHLKMLKEDKDSIYYKSLDKIFVEERELMIPHWIKWILIVVPALMLLFLIISVILKRQVKARTADLLLTNTELEEKISEHKQTEDALRESEDKFRTVAEQSPNMIFINKKGRVVYQNERCEEMMGYKTEEIYSPDFNFLTLMAPESVELARSSFKKHLAGTDVDTMEYTLVSKAGKRMNTVISTTLIDYEGEQAFMGIVTDITERKGVEQELLESEERYRALFEDNPIETIVVDKDARITMYNRAKRTSGERLPPIGDVMYKDYAASHLIDMHKELIECIQMAKSKNFTDQKYYNRFLDIRMFPFEEGAIITAIDQTEKKNLETKLQRTQKMESLGLMAGGIAHDLNNILSGIVSYPELLLMDLPENSPLRKPIETIKESGMSAADVVSDLLTVARGVASEKKVANLNIAVEECLGTAEHQRLQTMHSLITFKTELDSNLLNIRCSSTHIKKSLTNLITNASEAIEGNGTVTISTENRYLDEPLRGYEDVRTGEYAVLTVSDDGSGISVDDLERIFEPFYTKKVMGRSGTGLGLAVVWNTLQDHNGYINVNTSKKGTVFELYFPVTRDEVAIEGNAVPVGDYLGNGEKILVVDDEKRQREIACGILTKLGYIAEAVSSGEEAVKYLKEKSVDLVVLDMIMPKGINGRETYERIIKIQPDQKSIIASGYAETPDVKKALRLGAGKYIKKPYTIEKIGLAVKEELEK